MLLDLLNLLRSGRTRSLNELAQTLDTSVELVEVMLQNLERMGHVHLVHAREAYAHASCAHQENDCHAACQSCSRSGECIQVHSGRIWTVNSHPEPVEG
jgi:hypothetical protein